MKLTRAMTVLLAVALIAGPAAAQPTGCAPGTDGGEWRSYGHDLQNTRHQEAETLIGPAESSTLGVEWVFSAADAGGAGDFTGTPIIADGCVYVGSNAGWVFAMNADTGAAVWAKEVPLGGTINNTLAVEGGLVFAYVSLEGAPYVWALDQETGSTEWTVTVDEQQGSDAFASPVIYDGFVFVGISGDAAQHSDQTGERLSFFGSFVLIDIDTQQTWKTWTIDPSDEGEGFSGATVTTSLAVDEENDIGYVGTGSPFRPQFEHERANALLKVDLDRESPTFSQILASYKGDTFDAVVPGYSTLPCEDLPTPPPPPIVPGGRGTGACGDVDVDFAASPNLFRDADGDLVVGTSQKSGVYHLVDADTMEGIWTSRIGPAQPFGGVSGAYVEGSIITGSAPPGQLVSLDAASGDIEWVGLIGDVAHYGIPVATANGVAYTMSVPGILHAYDLETGLNTLTYVIDNGIDDIASFSGVSVARNTVYAAIGAQNTGADFAGLLNGYIVALRPGSLPMP